MSLASSQLCRGLADRGHKERRRVVAQQRTATSTPTSALLGNGKRYGRAKFPFPSPPTDFDHRLATVDSNAWAIRQHPSLEDLFHSGVLTCVRGKQIKSASHPLQPERRGDSDDNDSDDAVDNDKWLRPMPSPIYIVGTAHADQLGLSATAVRRAVGAIQPANIVVELCRTRAYIMNQKVRPGAMSSATRSDPPGEESRKDFSFSAFGRSLRLAVRAGGVSSGVLTFAMGSASLLTYLVPTGLRQRLQELVTAVLPTGAGAGAGAGTAQAESVVWGEEFAVAKRLAQDMQANVVLGDRPIEITVARCLSALKPGPILKRLWTRSTADDDQSQSQSRSPIQIESQSSLSSTVSRLDQMPIQSIGVALRDKALSGSLLSSLADTLPELIDPLFTERDAFLAWSAIGSSAARDAVSDRTHKKKEKSSAAGDDDDGDDMEDEVPIVIVCGAAHVRGVVFALTAYGPSMRWRHFAD